MITPRLQVTCLQCLRKVSAFQNKCVCGADPCEPSGVLKTDRLPAQNVNLLSSGILKQVVRE